MHARCANGIGAIYSTGDAREAAIVMIAADSVCTRMQQQVQKGVFRTGASCALSSGEGEKVPPVHPQPDCEPFGSI